MVSAIELEKSIYELMIPITLFEKLSSVIEQLSIETFLAPPPPASFQYIIFLLKYTETLKKSY